MNKTIRIALLAATLAVSAVTITGAGEDQGISRGKGMPVKGAQFGLTAVFNGSLTGEIVIDGQSVFITDKTTFHRVGVGPVESGESVHNAAIFIGGVMKGKKAIATMILIGEPEVSADFSQTTIPGAEGKPTDAR